MYLDKLEVVGFKSFAQKVVFTFHRGITAIVGPNGSGKSNFSDAIRWVLGEQSMKSLRGKKSEDVIFSGSEKSARLGYAEVSLTLNNEDGCVPIDYPEVEISRKVYRSGEGEYSLNRQASRLTDISLLLARLHLGSKSYSVIGQGMVDAILALTPFERKDFFDEAAGVKPFEMKREEAMRRLEASGDNLKMALITLKEITPRLKTLTRQVKRLERRDEILKELRVLLRQYYGFEWRALADARARHAQSLGQEQARRQEVTQSVATLQQELSSLTKESTHAKEYAQLQKEYQQQLEEKARLREEEVQLKMRHAVRTREYMRTAVPAAVVRETHVKLAKLHEAFRKAVTALAAASTPEALRPVRAMMEQIEKGFREVSAVIDPFVRVESNDDIAISLRTAGDAVQAVERTIAVLQERLQALASVEKEERTRIWQVQQQLQRVQTDLNQVVNAEHAVKIELAKLDTRKEDVAREAREEFQKYGVEDDWDVLTQEAPQTLSDGLHGDIHRLKGQLDIIGGIDPEIEREYREISERHIFLTTQVEDMRKAIADLEVAIEALDRTIKEDFERSFHRIDEGFQKYFKVLFGGGRARLQLVKEDRRSMAPDAAQTGEEGEGDVLPAVVEEAENPVHAFLDRHARRERVGVEIHATPPGKRLSSVHALSGGERALTSIALIAALIANNPAPFVVLDEVDAALDEANSMRFSSIIAELSKSTQFIVITHNRATMEQADILYGVTMGDDGISKVLSLKLEDAVRHGNR